MAESLQVCTESSGADICFSRPQALQTQQKSLKAAIEANQKLLTEKNAALVELEDALAEMEAELLLERKLPSLLSCLSCLVPAQQLSDL